MPEGSPDRERKLLDSARQEAWRLHHDYIGAEHILLGLAQEGGGLVASVFAALGIEMREIHRRVEELIAAGTTVGPRGPLPFTPRAKRVLELSLEEASGLGHTVLGPQHLLLGLLRVNEGTVAQVLSDLRVRIDDARQEVVRLLGGRRSPDEPE